MNSSVENHFAWVESAFSKKKPPLKLTNSFLIESHPVRPTKVTYHLQRQILNLSEV